MATSILKRSVLGAGAVAALLGTTAVAMAGGFAIREQSAEYQGMSFAGNAAGGGGLSAMFWNPAAVAQFDGIRSESHYSLIIPDSELTAQAGSTLIGIPGLATSTQIGKDALVPASYLSYRLNNWASLGFSLNSPFGLVSEPDAPWVGQTHAQTSSIKTYNGQVVMAVNVSPSFMLGAGVMIQRMTGTLKQAGGVLPTSPGVVVHGADTAFGWTLGGIWNPSKQTSLGLGYRSAIHQNLEGGIDLNRSALFPLGSASIRAPLTTPETATLSVRHELMPRWTALGTVEWSRWSCLDKLDIICTGDAIGANVLGCPTAGAAGVVASSLPLNWHDSWMFSIGAENKVNDKLTARAGLAYEISPVQNPAERTPRAPDADRIWASIGASYKWSDTVSLDLAYSHIFVEDSKIDRTQNGIRLVADVELSIDIVSASVKMKLGAQRDLEPLK